MGFANFSKINLLFLPKFYSAQLFEASEERTRIKSTKNLPMNKRLPGRHNKTEIPTLSGG